MSKEHNIHPDQWYDDNDELVQNQLIQNAPMMIYSFTLILLTNSETLGSNFGEDSVGQVTYCINVNVITYFLIPFYLY